MPYLRVFNGDKGSTEIIINKPEFLIGRIPGSADVVVEEDAVSRRHALIKPYGDGHMIEDAGSRTGTLVNGHQMPCCQLAHGVTIQVGSCIMEYRTDDDARAADLESSDPLTRSLRDRFSVLPEKAKMRLRTIPGKPDQLFKVGDTIEFGQGGVRLPTSAPLEQGQCLEVEITPASGNPRTFLGEILAVLKDRDVPEICIKLHFLSKSKHAEATARAGEWQDAWPAT